MRKIIHISDIHFGKIDQKSTRSLLTAFSVISPNLIIISGDLTQRAKPEQFKEAQKFIKDLKKLGFPSFVIPGNHDIEPLYKPVARALNPYLNYKKYISKNLEPIYSDDKLAIAGINTSRSTNLKNGGVNTSQIKKLEKWFATFSPKMTKIIVSHHPLDLPIHIPRYKLARKASGGMELLATYNIDLYLSGHYHRSSVVATSERYKTLGYSGISLQAGTVSRRQRGEVQSFNVITINKPRLLIETFLWKSEENLFRKSTENNFQLKDNAWKKV
ncbi:MAG: metallophosphoesterase [Candidatus Paceibacterota bacterium]